MRRLSWLLIVPFASMTSGCLGTCGGADFGRGNSDSSGNYTATYTNSSSEGGSSEAKDLAFDLTVDVTGKVQGTATESVSGRTTAVTGNVLDWIRACSTSTTTATLEFAFGSDDARSLTATRAKGDLTKFSRIATTYVRQGVTIGRGRIEFKKVESPVP